MRNIDGRVEDLLKGRVDYRKIFEDDTSITITHQQHEGTVKFYNVFDR
jgi:hypothetical protein